MAPTTLFEDLLSVTVRNTFLHFALLGPTDGDCESKEQPSVMRSVTAPVFKQPPRTEMVGEEEDNEEDGADDNGTQPCLERVMTLDAFEEPSACNVGRGIAASQDLEPVIEQSDGEECVQQQQQQQQLQLCGQQQMPGVQPFVVPVCYIPNTFQAAAAAAQPQNAITMGAAWTDMMAVASSGSDMARTASAGSSGRDSHSTGDVAPSGSSACQRFARPHAAKRGEGQRVTVMLRSLPSSFTRSMLFKLMDTEGFAGKYDFVYLPIDFRTHGASGFAFVNLVTAAEAMRFYRHFDGFARWPVALATSKACSVGWSDPYQGLDANVGRYRNSPLMHEIVPDSYRPVLFSDGARVPFPPPTNKIKPPRQGTERMFV
mmetsp:Transcript_26386/g.68736  ORF Transcript_26386/g.68736 Transcript_26386/m.68736 type:complete len:373 (-) Transcript_26386:93-1211(-)